MSNEKIHFWIATGHVVYLEKTEGGKQFRTRDYNTLLKTKTQRVLLKEVSSCQHAFFMRSTQEVDQTKVITVDMVVTNLSYLGHFTEKDFTAGVDMPPVDAPKVSSEEPPRFQ